MCLDIHNDCVCMYLLRKLEQLGNTILVRGRMKMPSTTSMPHTARAASNQSHSSSHMSSSSSTGSSVPLSSVHSQSLYNEIQARSISRQKEIEDKMKDIVNTLQKAAPASAPGNDNNNKP